MAGWFQYAYRRLAPTATVRRCGGIIFLATTGSYIESKREEIPFSHRSRYLQHSKGVISLFL
ncbi:hypothetical protein OROMI_005282 [Orobanche minor]